MDYMLLADRSVLPYTGLTTCAEAVEEIEKNGALGYYWRSPADVNQWVCILAGGNEWDSKRITDVPPEILLAAMLE